MSSLFSRLMDGGVESHFRRDQGGRLVFIPFTLKGKCYFVDSKSDEEKIRAFVKMYRSASTLLSWMTLPSSFVPVVILDDYAGMTPPHHRLAIVIGISLFFWLVLVALQLMLWAVYKKTVPSLSASLSEVGPDFKSQLIVSPEQRRVHRVALGIALACVGLMILILFAVSARPHSRVIRRDPSAVCSQSEGGDGHRSERQPGI
jgi:hypothetical protein